MKKWLVILALSCPAQAHELFDGEWIDLTHEFSAETIYWPTADSFKKETVFEGRVEAGFTTRRIISAPPNMAARTWTRQFISLKTATPWSKCRWSN